MRDKRDKNVEAMLKDVELCSEVEEDAKRFEKQVYNPTIEDIQRKNKSNLSEYDYILNQTNKLIAIVPIMIFLCVIISVVAFAGDLLFLQPIVVCVFFVGIAIFFLIALSGSLSKYGVKDYAWRTKKDQMKYTTGVVTRFKKIQNARSMYAVVGVEIAGKERAVLEVDVNVNVGDVVDIFWFEDKPLRLYLEKSQNQSKDAHIYINHE